MVAKHLLVPTSILALPLWYTPPFTIMQVAVVACGCVGAGARVVGKALRIEWTASELMWRSRSSRGSHRIGLQGPGSRAVLRGVGGSAARVRVFVVPLSGRIKPGPEFSRVPFLGCMTQLRPNRCSPPSFATRHTNTPDGE